MTREEKTALIQELAQALREVPGFYLVHLGPLNAEETVKLRRTFYEKGLRVRVVKNTLLYKAFQAAGIAEAESFVPALYESTALILCATDVKAPAQVLQDFQKALKKDYPAFKAAYVEESAFVGAQYLDALLRFKTKNELLGELIARLQLPIQRLLGSLQSGGQTLAGVLKTLSER